MTSQRNRPSVSFPDVRGGCNHLERPGYPVDRVSRPARLKLLLLALVGALTISGCGFDVYKLPLPGGTDVGDDPVTVHIMFRDVLDLVPQSSVKVNDVSVGKVTDVRLDGFTADVTVQLRRGTELPDNAVASIRQTSLLGEKFVSLAAPESGASTEPLASGDVIPLERSGRNPEVEEVLGALSLLLNGGGVAQLRTIARELNIALEGREGTARSVLDQVRLLMTPARRQQGRHRQRHRQAQRPVGLAQQAARHDRRRPRGAAVGAGLDRQAARRPGQDAARRSPTSATSAYA